MGTTIHCNGSKFAGDAPDSIDALLDRMRTHAIEPLWLEGTSCEDRSADDCTAITFGGNFVTYSHAFDIETNDPELVAKLRAAIRANIETFYGSDAGVRHAHAKEIAARDARRRAR